MSLDPLQENLLHRAVIGDLVTRSASRFGDRTFLISGDQRVSFRALNEQSCRAAQAFLQMGVKPGDRVAFITHNCLHYLYCAFGLAKIGAISVPMNFMLKGHEIVAQLRDAEPVAFLVEDSLIDAVRPVQDQLPSVRYFGRLDFGKRAKPDGWVNVSDFFAADLQASEPEVIIDDHAVATLIYTTGTESFSKGVMTTHLNYFMALLHLIPDADFRRDDAFILDIPLFHAAGNTVLLGALTVGARAVLTYAPDPVQTVRLTQNEKITYWVYPPTMFAALLAVPGLQSHDLSSLKKCVSFGSVIPTVLLERWRALKRDLEWRNYYGQTESSPVGTTSTPDAFERKKGSIGIADTATAVKVFDEKDCELPAGQIGELVIRSPAVMKGYWRQEELTAKAFSGGWLHTGDLGYSDEEGWIYFVDRKKDMIKSGGENISSQEVEGVLLRHPQIAMAAVLGIPDPHWTEAVAAFVVPKPGATLAEEEVIAFCKEQMAGYKVPKKVVLRSALPLTPTGKILKRQIRAELVPPEENEVPRSGG